MFSAQELPKEITGFYKTSVCKSITLFVVGRCRDHR